MIEHADAILLALVGFGYVVGARTLWAYAASIRRALRRRTYPCYCGRGPQVIATVCDDCLAVNLERIRKFPLPERYDPQPLIPRPPESILRPPPPAPSPARWTTGAMGSTALGRRMLTAAALQCECGALGRTCHHCMRALLPRCESST